VQLKPTRPTTSPARLAYRRTGDLKQAEQYLTKAAGLKQSAEIEFDLGVLYRGSASRRRRSSTTRRAPARPEARRRPLGRGAHLLAGQALQGRGEELRDLPQVTGESKDAEIARKRIKELKGMK